MSRTVVDDLGTAVTVPDVCRRVVSLVPSITESIAETDRDALVGATQWCEFPADLDVTRVRGTKNPDWKAIVALRPDLVVVNQEENREIDVRRLRDAGVPVWVTRIESVDDALASLSRMFTDALGWPVPEWLEQAELAWQAPAELDGPRVAAVIWRNPWMVVGRDTFSGDVLERLGCVNAFADADSRYPTVEDGTLDALGLDVVLLPSEPYRFTDGDGPDAFSRTPTALFDGRLLTWYGPTLLRARRELVAAIATAIGTADRPSD